jgi:hypothetical protein
MMHACRTQNQLESKLRWNLIRLLPRCSQRGMSAMGQSLLNCT